MLSILGGPALRFPYGFNRSNPRHLPFFPFRHRSTPRHLSFLTVQRYYNLISNLHLASITTQLHTMVAHIESMRKMAIFTPGDPESHWYNRFGSLRPPFAYAKSRHVAPRSLRVAVVGFVVVLIVVFFFFLTVVFLFVLFLVGLLASEDISIYQRSGLVGLFGLAF